MPDDGYTQYLLAGIQPSGIYDIIRTILDPEQPVSGIQNIPNNSIRNITPGFPNLHKFPYLCALFINEIQPDCRYY
ncbi:hypothetical protein BLX24_13160 [Arsenicibacter rosenii]|uniref:Uncharacterized protein n=1 Tax=Arsenicibacter rosenii TaxID=1750698 RepID=A0A1S2VIF4_9BACT|nr:hypothetical protein BLX24_13160 [Arsenicibacter rosenii]